MSFAAAHGPHKIINLKVLKRTPLFVRADEAIEIAKRLMVGYGTTRISRSALDSRSTSCRRVISGARRYSHPLMGSRWGVSFSMAAVVSGPTTACRALKHRGVVCLYKHLLGGRLPG